VSPVFGEKHPSATLRMVSEIVGGREFHITLSWGGDAANSIG
jgi:hypothetical protein